MTGGRVSGPLWALVLTSLVAGAYPAFAQKPDEPPSGALTFPNLVSKDVKLPAIVVPKGEPPLVTLPPLNLPGVAVLTRDNVPREVVLPKGDTFLLVNLPGLSLVIPDLADLTAFGDSVFALMLDQVAPVNQLFASTSAVLTTTIDQLVDTLVSGGSGPSGAPAIAAPSVSILALGASNVWTWNGLSVTSADHSGFKFQADGGGDPVTGSTLPVRATTRADFPGILWDASSEFGYGRGTVFFGATGGVSRSDIDLGAGAALSKAGIKDAGSVELTSWSAGAFALIVTDAWYAGGTAGGSWGEAETENDLTGAMSDYDLTSFTSSVFAGTILPLSETVRLDLRGTLAYQRTSADAHTDTLGIAYGEHAIEAANATASARLFAVFRQSGDVTLRPYVQVGAARRFHYDNALDIGGVDFTFTDAGSGVFAAGGLDFEIGQSWHLSAGIRRDHTSDYDSLSGRFGLMVRLN